MASAVTDRNGFSLTENQELIEYEKLIKLRNDFFANNHSSPKLPRQSGGLSNPPSASGPLPLPPVSSSRMTNGTHPSSQASNAASAQVAANSHVTKPLTNSFKPKSPNNHKVPTPAPGSSGIDPIFLTKSDVLVRAEIQQKRQRIERALEEQIHQKRKQKIFDQEALPDFNATEVLRKAQELVKPIKVYEKSRTNGAASSSDSFDEKTFYSSQVESTTTEEADESHKWRPHRICNFFLKGEHCRYGDACTFSHDPKLKQKLEAEGSQAMDLDSVNADQQTSLRPDKPPAHASTKPPIPHPPTKEGTSIASMSQSERALQERIAQLEAELANRSRNEQQLRPDATVRQHAKELNESQEDSAYSPPGPDEFGRDIGLREVETRQPATKQQPPPGHVQPPPREFALRNGRSASPLPNNVRVVRNHIMSPVAPQPSRVSPLAVAKVPQVSQVQRNHGENRHLSRASNTEVTSAGQSPKATLQPLSSKKRRRGLDPQEHNRNVVPRRELGSPDVRIKDEPTSPPPFGDAVEIRQIRPRQEAPRQLYVDAAAPQYRDQEPMIYQPRAGERPMYNQPYDDRGPLTPLARRVVSRNGQRYMPNEEQDLRRVVSARQVRAPMSPAPHPVQYSAPHPRTIRPASQVNTSPTGQPMAPQYRASVQPGPATYVPHDRSPSPPLRRMQVSPFGRKPIAMAPPPRRIMIDQWGRECIEIPVNAGRQVSVAPVTSRLEYDNRYEQSAPRSVRQPHFVSVDDEGQYIRRIASPTSQPVFEYPQHRNTQVVETNSRSMPFAESYVTRNESTHPAEYPEARLATRYADAPEAREGMIRMQSARPVERQYEVPREEVARIQSVRPQQPRIVQLGERADGRAQVSRQVSVFGNDGGMRPVGYAVEQRPRYEYASQEQDRGYLEEMPDEGGNYEASGLAGQGRRQVLH